MMIQLTATRVKYFETSTLQNLTKDSPQKAQQKRTETFCFDKEYFERDSSYLWT